MSRPLRIEFPNAWYHIINRGRRSELIYLNEQDYRHFIAVVKDACEMWQLRVAAYCLLPNHYHLLVQTPAGNIARIMRHVDGVYTQRFNRSHGHDGSLFRGRYKSILVDADSYLLQLLKYIHRNPVKAGLADDLDSYEWSSHRAYTSRHAKWDWLFRDFVFSMLHAEPKEQAKAYRRLMREEDDERLLEIVDRSRWPAVLGSEIFYRKIKGEFGHAEPDSDVPQVRDLLPDASHIMKMVCHSYRVTEDILLRSRRGLFNEPRDLAIYLVRRLRGDSLKCIGRDFKISKISSVSSAIRSISVKMEIDKALRDRVEEIRQLIIRKNDKY